MKSTKRFKTALLAAILISTNAICRADVTLALNTEFVKKYRNKATITTNLRVDVHPKSPHAIAKSGDDGDIHMAGRDTVILLPLVAEILNARLETDAVQLLTQTSGEQPLSVTGVWRLWFEHVGKKNQIQGKPVPVPATSNPDHLFELHPLTSFGGVDVLDSFAEIKNDKITPPKVYEAYAASKAFPYYEDIDATIQASDSAITIASSQSKFNYAEFVMELAGKPKDVGDGYMVLANIYDTEDLEEPLTSEVRRMVFVKGTSAADELLKLSKGDTLHVLGIPRVNLSEVFAIASKHGTDAVEVKLPYEMIVAAILPEK
jgi:hypothetical protein